MNERVNFSRSNRGYPIVDLMIHPDETPPLPNKRVLCRHPFQETKRAYVEPASVEPLLQVMPENITSNCFYSLRVTQYH